MEMKFYKCAICGQIVAIVEGTGVPLVCCGEEMEELIPGSVDASHEKHVPVIEVSGDTVTVTVGSALHPMTKEHSIPAERGGDFYLINGAMTKPEDAGIFAASSTKETEEAK